MGIGARLKEIIDEKGTNVNQIAKQTSTSPMTIYSIIKRDNTKVDIDILLKICNALNISVEDIYQPNFKSDNNGNVSKTMQSVSNINLSEDETELVNLFRKLTSKDQQRYIVRMEDTINSYSPAESATSKTTTIYRAARSADNHPAEVVETTKDFSKIPPTDIKL